MAYPGSRGCRGHSGPASSGHYKNVGNRGCVSHNSGTVGLTNNSTLGGNGYYCPSNQFTWSVPNLEDEVISVAIHNELRNAVVNEIARRRRNYSNANAQGVGSGDIINNERLKTLRNEIAALASWSLPSVVTDANMEDGDYIQAEQYQALRDRLNVISNDCVCNCNYCTCNCNYCTCNCNYSCTCNCNYSDLFLKEDIEYAA